MSRMIDRMSDSKWSFDYDLKNRVALKAIIAEARSKPILVADSLADYATGQFFNKSVDYGEDLDLCKNIPNAAPIYPRMWIEMKLGQPISMFTKGLPDKIDYLPYCIGGILCSLTLDEAKDEYTNRKAPHVPYLANTYPDAKWILNLIVFSEFNKFEMFVSEMVGIAVDENGRMLGYKQATSKSDLGVKFIAWLLLLPISFMHCRNVNTVPVDPNPKLNKKRAKHGKLPLLRYHTLDIALMRRVLDTEGRVAQTSDIKMGLHICHGHFKHFGSASLSGHPAGIDTKPLFGKHVGMYWWGDMVRGDSQHGVIAKDYQKQGDRVPSRAIEQAAAMIHSTEKKE